MPNRIKEIRDNILKMTQPEFAEALGGEPEWYRQRVARLESGDTALTDIVADEIAAKLGIHVWELFVSPELANLEPSATLKQDRLTPNEEEVISMYRLVKSPVQKMIYELLWNYSKKSPRK